MILVDYSQVSLAAIMIFSKDIAVGDNEQNRGIIRHAILSSILSNKKKFGREYGQIVICCDSKKYWRRDAFPNYKSSRKVNRDKSDLDWKFIFSCMDELKQDLIDNFPYKVLTVDKCEADDIIAVLAKWSQDNDLMQEGIIEESKRLMIISSDKDFRQLHQYHNVKQFSPMQKKFVERPKNVKEFINEHIATGDVSDSIMNVLSSDNCFVDKIRQTPMKKSRLAEFISKGILECSNDSEIRNWHRNETLISFEKIPQEISDNIISAFETHEVTGSQGKIFKYLINNECKLLVNQIEEF